VHAGFMISTCYGPEPEFVERKAKTTAPVTQWQVIKNDAKQL